MTETGQEETQNNPDVRDQYATEYQNLKGPRLSIRQKVFNAFYGNKQEPTERVNLEEPQQ